MAVEAPTLYARGLKTHENKIPPNPDIKYKVVSFQNPRPFSRPDPITIVDKRLRARCIKLAWRKTGVINLHTCPLLFILRASFQPSLSNALGLGAKNSVFTM